MANKGTFQCVGQNIDQHKFTDNNSVLIHIEWKGGDNSVLIQVEQEGGDGNYALQNLS